MAKADRQREAHLGLKKRKERKLQSGGFPTRIYQTTHVTGGTIMGIDPHTSVVSPHLQHWDAENLLWSVHPTTPSTLGTTRPALWVRSHCGSVTTSTAMSNSHGHFNRG
jgi:hypothetical protein